MKRLGRFVVNSFVLFWSYFLSSTLCIAVLQTLMRLFIDANSKGEYLWKTLLSYACMLLTCMIHLKVFASTYKTGYLACMNGEEWRVGSAAGYTVRNLDFWLNTIGFAIWPVIVPRFSGAIHLLYVSPEFLAGFPAAVLSVPTVSLPIVVLSLVGWILTLRGWCKGRMRHN